MLFQCKAVSELSCLISFLIFALQIYRSARSVNKVSGRLGDQCQNQELWIWAVNLGAEGYSQHSREMRMKGFLVVPHHCQLLAMARRVVWVCTWRTEGLWARWGARVCCKSGKSEFSEAVYISDTELEQGLQTRDQGNHLENFSESFSHDFFSLFFLPIWFTDLPAVITIPEFWELRRVPWFHYL